MKLKTTLGILLTIGVLFFLFSYCMAPLSVEHGIHVSQAKYMAQGLTPYQDFSLQETPLGIAILSLLYRIVGTDASGYWASVWLVFVHLLNIVLLGKLMKRVSVHTSEMLAGLIFYVLLVYSSDALMLNLEPFAISFILGSCLLILKRNKRGMLGAGLCFALATACKVHTLVLLPALLVLAFWGGKRNQFKAEKGLLFLAASVVFTLIGAIGIATFSQNPEWTKQLIPIPENNFITIHKIWHSRLTYAIIQGGRCSLFFFLALPWVWKKMHTHGKRFTIIGMLAFLCYLTVLMWEIKVSNGMLVYPFIAIALAHILQAIPNKRWAVALGIAAIITPIFLTVREFQKLDYGQAKTAQQEELATLNEIIQNPGTAVVLFDQCNEYDLGPQIFSEFPRIQPVSLKTSRLGQENQNAEIESLIGQISEADYVIMNEDGFSLLSFSADSDAFFDAISERKSYGTGSYLIYAK